MYVGGDCSIHSLSGCNSRGERVDGRTMSLNDYGTGISTHTHTYTPRGAGHTERTWLWCGCARVVPVPLRPVFVLVSCLSLHLVCMPRTSWVNIHADAIA